MATRLAQPDRERHRAISELIQALHGGTISSRRELEESKRALAIKYNLSSFPSNSEIIAELSKEERERWRELACVSPRRSASGIVIVTVFSAPFMCPHGTCTFCPGGPTIGTPQSYVLGGPGMKGALAAGYDPFSQVRNSLSRYRANGHDTSKVETIIEGGTFIALPLQYQLQFVKGVYDGLNDSVSDSLERTQQSNETSDNRCVGLTIESKPDWCQPRHIDQMLSYGVTRLEIGVQSLRDSVLRASNRGHTVEDTIRAFRTARDAGLKVCAHMMPGLPDSNPEWDLEDLTRLFEDESLKPDMIKVYPTLAVKGTALARLYEKRRYDPYDLETVIEILARMKQVVPRWHRIMRIQREIPEKDIAAGVKAGNLRELVLKRVAEKGTRCNCIRCREVVLAEPGRLLKDDKLSLNKYEYEASGGVEVFCSYEFESAGKIAGFVRMRYPSESAYRIEVRDSCVIRELKVYGRVVGLGQRDPTAWQHRGLGGALLAEAETVARARFGSKKILVTSAVGTREYYRRHGYASMGPYMAKDL